MAGKRQATTNLNHENWDQEDEAEERGTFRKAPEDELKNRVIKKARRKVTAGGSGADTTDDGAPKSVFSGFAGFGKSNSSTPTASPFSFLSKIPGPPADSLNSITTAKTFSFGPVAKTADSTEKKDDKYTENGSATKENVKDNTVKSANYQSKIKGLNQAVSEWIKIHVDKNPLCILTPIFKDYEKYLNDIEEEEKTADKFSTNNTSAKEKKLPSDTASSVSNFKFSTSPAKPGTNITSTSVASPVFSFGSTSTSASGIPTTSSIFTNVSKPASEETKTATFSFGIKSPENKNGGNEAQTVSSSKGFSFGLKSDNKLSSASSTPFTFGKPAASNGDTNESKPAAFSFKPGSTTFNFGNIKPPVAAGPSTSEGANGADDEEDQPPKMEFRQVVEEDAVYSKKCKVFVKKDGAFADRGVGTLYLKPVKDSEKTQLLVRADTNLGNILVNLILSTGIPTQRMGKNNVMMVCLPTPDVEKATSMLLRVKTAEEADELLAELDKYKK
ncbi:nuclear pore complex protein Nup50 [Anastrepha obliqua]|uniref:nuclear pore complex protein Nup50 n=1 Tax=Anastrepha obliqua TaxID=95512 RepID=UPI00240A3C8F|nr:nuclear pore complex protein Nup50 [Anastrepha obliqua]